MKKIVYSLLLLSFTLLLGMGCSKEDLTTTPTDQVSGPVIFESSEKAMTAVTGIYRSLNQYGYGSGWHHENGGLQAFILALDLRGEDHIMDSSGSGWFWYDYRVDTQGDYRHNAGHQYTWWNYFYSVINNCNYIIANEERLTKDGSPMGMYVMAQAYAMRSFSYMWLVQCYQQNDPSLPGVPIYTEPTTPESEGKGRGTVQDVYNQANKDLDHAIELYEKAGKIPTRTSEEVDVYVAYGFKARHALVQHDYQTALEYAKKALDKPGLKIGSPDDIATINNCDKPNVMWGLKVITDQASVNGEIFYHMDADSGNKYSSARHLISKWLYDGIPDSDCRKAWWQAPLPEDQWGIAGDPEHKGEGSRRSWCQKKLVFSNVQASEGDLIFMRAEEMLLIAAEASCTLQKYDEARQFLLQLGSKRMPGDSYAKRLEKIANGNTLNPNTNGNLLNLMDEILFQRRVELWSEVPRTHDLLRLGLGYNRDYPDSNHTDKIKKEPKSPDFIMWLPLSEFDGNKALDVTKDQNP